MIKNYDNKLRVEEMGFKKFKFHYGKDGVEVINKYLPEAKLIKL